MVVGGLVFTFAWRCCLVSLFCLSLLLVMSTMTVNLSRAQDGDPVPESTDDPMMVETPTDAPTDLPTNPPTEIPTDLPTPTDEPAPVPTDTPLPTEVPIETALPSPTETLEVTVTDETPTLLPSVEPTVETVEPLPNLELTEEAPLAAALEELSLLSSSPGCTYDVPASDTTALIAAINLANQSGGPAVLCLEGGTYTLTTVYASGTSGNNGLPAITVPLTIEGNGATITRSSTDNFRILEASHGSYLILRDLHLTNGSAAKGGAIFMSAVLYLERVTISGNSASDQGGGIAINRGSLFMTDSTITGNTAVNGGGGNAYQQSVIQIDNSTFANNTAPDGTGPTHPTPLTLATTRSALA